MIYQFFNCCVALFSDPLDVLGPDELALPLPPSPSSCYVVYFEDRVLEMSVCVRVYECVSVCVTSSEKGSAQSGSALQKPEYMHLTFLCHRYL